MRYYCLLFFRSDNATALSAVIKPAFAEKFEMDDRESPRVVKRMATLKSKGIVFRMPQRYYWTLSSSGFVESCNVIDHVKWLLKSVKPDTTLANFPRDGSVSGLHFYWEGNGTGGGPTVDQKVAKLLIRHRLDLSFGFNFADR